VNDQLTWIVGTGLSIIAIIGGIIARDRQLTRMISEGDDKVHERVNRVRDEYVRRSDLDGHIQRLDANIQTLAKDVREQSQETTRRLDALIAAMAKRPD